jgi:hypothetical protein
VNAWTAAILFIMVATDASSLVSYITRFTEESFATLIAIIFIYEAVVKLWKIGDQLDVVSRPRLQLYTHLLITVFQGTVVIGYGSFNHR